MKRTLTLAVLALVTMSSVAFGQIYSNGTNLVIPDSPAVSSTISVAGGPAVITDLNVCFAATHTFDGDLDVILEGPGGGVLRLVNNRGGSGDNFGNFVTGTTLNDGSPSLATGVAPFAGSFAPDGGAQAAAEGAPATTLANLAAYNGLDSNGTWRLWLNDSASGDTGNLNYWSLSFNGAGADASCALDAPTPPPSTDLGNLTPAGITITQGHAAAQIHWFKVTLTSAVGAPNWASADTLGSILSAGAFGANDTEIGLYNSLGQLVSTNDDINFGGGTLTSRINAGTPPPQVPAGGAAVASLAAGTYYVAVGGFDTVFGANFGVTSTSTTTGSITLNLSTNVPEPATAALLAFGCLGLLRRRSR